MSFYGGLFKSLGIIKNVGEKNLVTELMKTPDKELIVPKIRNFEINSRHQADTLTLQDDDGYKYALVVVDTTTRLSDARPMKTHNSKTVKEALISIYKGKILKKPRVLETDAGTEFKGAVTKWLNDNDIEHKIGRTNRHRQVALAEFLNYIIGKAVGTRQNAEELLSGEVSKQWVDDLPKIIAYYNSYEKKKKYGTTTEKQIEKKLKTTRTIQCKDGSCNLLEMGTKVRVILDQPLNIPDNSKLYGKFRAGDLRWDRTVRTIEKLSLKPGSPPLYTVSGIGNALYTREQLQVIDEDETAPNESARRKWTVEKILKKQSKNGLVHYLVKWKGFKKPTLVSRKLLVQDVPDKIKDYENKNKK